MKSKICELYQRLRKGLGLTECEPAANPECVAVSTASEPPQRGGDKWPSESFLDVRRILLNREDQKNWSFEKLAPFITEMMNGETVAFYRKAFGYLYGSGLAGDYHEYGCYSARTFRMALSETYKWQMNDLMLFAFDSFQGLPEPQSNPRLKSWVRGAMAMTVDEFKQLVCELGFGLERVVITEGFFKDTLNTELQRHLLGSNRSIAFCNIDCDLRESAEEVFRFIEPLVKEGTLVYLDDYFVGYGGRLDQGVAGAYRNFLARSNWKSEEFMSVGFWGKAFVLYR